MLIGFIILMIAGYVLQPVMGNISSHEADFGGLIFLWSTLLSAILFLISIVRKPEVVVAEKKDKSDQAPK